MSQPFLFSAKSTTCANNSGHAHVQESPRDYRRIEQREPELSSESKPKKLHLNSCKDSALDQLRVPLELRRQQLAFDAE